MGRSQEWSPQIFPQGNGKSREILLDEALADIRRSNGSCSGKRAANPRPTRQEWFFACLKGTLKSYLRPGGISRVSLEQVDGLKRRIQISCGVSEEEIKEVVASWIDAMPYSDSKRVKEIRRKYWPPDQTGMARPSTTARGLSSTSRDAAEA